MKLTNLLGLPEPLIRAIENDPYDKGECDFSATELISPAYQRRLQRDLREEITEDASEKIWSLMGQAVHGILERATMPGYTMERRYIATVDGFRIGAKIDVLNEVEGILDDYKVTSAFKFTRKDGLLHVPEEYEQQINIQAECIFQETGVDLKKGRIIGILRDWSRMDAQRDSGYPQFQVQAMEVRIWKQPDRLAYIRERMKAHIDAKTLAIESIPVCSSHETWERPSTYAIEKKGATRAVRVFHSISEAEEYIVSAQEKQSKKGEENQLSLAHRKGERIRCNAYCNVSFKCPSYQATK